jgi:hypothetical protein
MIKNRVKFGLTLSNRGVVIGATTVAEMMQLAAEAQDKREEGAEDVAANGEARLDYDEATRSGPTRPRVSPFWLWGQCLTGEIYFDERKFTVLVYRIDARFYRPRHQ